MARGLGAVPIPDGVRGRNIGLSKPELDDLADRAGVFDGVSALWPVSASFLGGDRPERVEVLVTSASYFQLLGAFALVALLLAACYVLARRATSAIRSSRSGRSSKGGLSIAACSEVGSGSGIDLPSARV